MSSTFWGRLLFLAIFTLQLPTQAEVREVLVVTHPQTRFDRDARAGRGTLALLRDTKYREKYVLLTDFDEKLTFDPRNLRFETVHSLGGELARNLGPAKFTVAGGYLTACLSSTIEELVVHSKATFIRVAMDATYSYISLIHFSGEKYADSPRTLRELERKVGSQGAPLVEALSEAGVYLHRALTSALAHAQESPGNIDLELKIHGRPLQTIKGAGKGPTRRLVIDFD